MAIATGYSAALEMWRNGPMPPELDALQARYGERWSLYDGTLFANMARENPYRDDPAIYQNTQLLWKNAEAIVDFYAGVIYQGALSDEPEQGAIPIKLLVEGEAADNLMLAINTLHDTWNWQQQMSLRPMYAAALGDCLTELVDDLARGFVYPRIIWPGYVREIELDDVDNVLAYTLEYRAVEKQIDGSLRAYKYRKEVDKEAIRHFREDQPWATTERPAVVPNPYGFVPAIWDRHRIGAPGMVRGRSALDGTRQALLSLNSVFSHAFDFQRRAFWAPLMVAGGGVSSDVNLTAAPTTEFSLAESFRVLRVKEGATLLQPTFDVGKTREMLQDIKDGILAESPESQFYTRIREMQTVTAPGVAAAQGDVASRVDLVRAGADSQSVKLDQMAITMCAIRAKRDWQVGPDRRQRPLTKRQQVFTVFDEQSFARGELEFRIEKRPLVPVTEAEKLETALQKQALGIPLEVLLPDLDYTEEQITDIMAARRRDAERYAVAVNDGAFGDDFTEGQGGQAA